MIGTKYGEFTIGKGYFGETVIGKLAGQRKDRKFHVSPRSDGTIQIQGDNTIGVFDFRTGKGLLNAKGGTYPHLYGATPFQFPTEFVAACLAVCPALGSETTMGGVTIVNTIQVI